jgi:hypothetical protein
MGDLGTDWGLKASFKRNTQALFSFHGRVYVQQGDKMK